jgi:hypothetical protein
MTMQKNIPTMRLTLEPTNGASIDDTCIKAAEVATLLGVAVVFEFNGERVYVSPGQDGQSVADRWARPSG